MDEDDATMNNLNMRQWLNTRCQHADIEYYYGHSKTKVEACNADLSNVQGDVLLLASDDMIPIEYGYDEVIFRAFKDTYPDFDGAVKFWDGLRPKDDPLMTLSIIGVPLYRRFGYIYHPSYKSVYCDNEQTLVYMALEKLARCDLCIIQHRWTSEPWDTLHARNESRELYQIDATTFQTRADRGFDIEGILHACAA